MLHVLSLALVLSGLWLVLSGFFTPLLIGLGVISVAITVYVAERMDVIDHEGHPIHLAPRAFTYWLWLLKEILVSNISVARTILGIGEKAHPTIFRTKASQTTEVGRVTYANSITLTPGTVTVGIDADGSFEVHALTTSSRAGVESLVMDKKCTALEGSITSIEEAKS